MITLICYESNQFDYKLIDYFFNVDYVADNVYMHL